MLVTEDVSSFLSPLT